MAKNKKGSNKKINNVNQVKQKKTKGRSLNIKIVGLGGAGCAVVSRLMKFRIPNVELIAINTDAQSLSGASAHKRVRIGKTLTKGLGAGMDPNLGQQAAEQSRKDLVEALRGADLIFLIAGLGGGTGSGALPFVVDLAKELGVLTISLVTKPFIFEGPQRMLIAEQTLKALEPKADTLITIANECILKVIDRKTPLLEAFGVVDNVLKQSIQSITDIINLSGLVNVDLADLRTVLQGAGPALLSIGEAEGEERAISAIKAAIANPLLDLSIKGATGIIFIVTGSQDLTMHEINEAAKYIIDLADPNCRIIFGAVLDDSMQDKIKITIIATGLNKNLTGEHLETRKMMEPLPINLIERKPIERKEERVSLSTITEAPEEIAIAQVKTEPEVTPIFKPEKITIDGNNELEIPAFLRKKNNKNKK